MERAEIRNSKIRDFTSGPVEAVVEKLHNTFPKLTPDHLSYIGLAGVGLGAYLAAKRSRRNTQASLTFASFVSIGLAQLSDAVDGPLARLVEKENPGKQDFMQGQLVDIRSDRMQEFTLAMSRAIQANRREDTTAEMASYLSAATNPLPSLSKVAAESVGVSVPESGRNIFGFIGTRAGRGIFGTIATVFPEVKGVRLQLFLDSVAVLANTYTAADRLKRVLDNYDKGSLPHEMRIQAKARFKDTAVIAMGILVASASTYQFLRGDRIRESKHK